MNRAMQALLAVMGAALLIGAVALCTTGCPMSAVQQQATVADVAAHTFNRALPVVVDAYEADVRGAIDRACCDRAAMEAAAARTQARWLPVRAAWEATRVAHDAWRVELERCRHLADGGACGPTLPGLLANFTDRITAARCAVRALGHPELDVFPGTPACPAPATDGGFDGP